jgi:hypothetical protein
MESFYSIIYYRPNSFTDELFALGLLASGGEGPFIELSNARMNLLKRLIHPSQFTSIQRHLRNLSKSVELDRKAPNELLLFDPRYSKERLEELSMNTKGAVIYGKPVAINDWLNVTLFNTFVHHVLGGKRTTKVSERPVFQLKWKAFYQSNRFSDWSRNSLISEFTDTDIDLKMDLFSNERKTIVKGIDFDLKPETVKLKIYETKLMNNLFSEFKFIIVHPGPRKKKGAELLKSFQETNKKIEFQKFSVFKNSKH